MIKKTRESSHFERFFKAMSTPKLSKYGWIQISLQKPLKLAGFTSNLITFFGFTYFSVGYAVRVSLRVPKISKYWGERLRELTLAGTDADKMKDYATLA